MTSQTSPGSRGFQVTRNHVEASKSYDPCAGIRFSPSADTDELFDALKIAFPKGKSHRQRMRLALIEYLVREAEIEQQSKPQEQLQIKGG